MFVYNKTTTCFILLLIIVCSLLILVNLFYFMQYHNSHSIKRADDYSITDLLNAQKIVIESMIPTKETVEKYDMNKDGEITSFDVEIIKQFILGYYDFYMVRNGNRVAIKEG